MAAYKFIQKKGYSGKYSTVAAFIKNHKNEEITKATIRFETAPGLQAQVDWKENILFYGSQVVGKPHLVVAIGIDADKKRQLTYFIFLLHSVMEYLYIYVLYLQEMISEHLNLCLKI